jgi:hypothetical protein
MLRIIVINFYLTRFDLTIKVFRNLLYGLIIVRIQQYTILA